MPHIYNKTISALLAEIGIPADKMPRVLALVDVARRDGAINYAGEFLHRLALRLNQDSLNGRALARALGFLDNESLEQAAKAFCVSKQYLHRVQTELERKLGDLRFVRPAAVGEPVGFVDFAGPFGEKNPPQD